MRTYKLKELLSIKNGKDHKGLNNGSIPIFGSGGIMRYGDQSIYNDESILLPRKGTLSNIQYVNKPFWTVDTIYYTKINKELANPFYLFNFLKSLDLSKLNTGTGVPSMTFDSYYNLDIHLPDLPTQQKIASVLSALDSKIELNNRINAELEAMAKTLYDYWFVQFDFPDKNGKPYKTSGGKMVWNEELKREIPDGWEVLDLEKVESNIVTGKTPSTTNPNYYNGNIPFITIGDVRGNMHIVSTLQKLTIDGANQQTNKYIPKGAICVTCIASPGLVGFATEDSQTNQQLNSVVCKNSENRFYLYFYLIDYFKYSSAKTGNTFANMNKGDFSAIQVIKPKKEILISFSNTLKSTVDKILINSQENQQLTELRDWLLPMLMNGQVKVMDKVENELSMAAEAEVKYGK
jgi:type I restriction enzyme S subunit